MEPIAHRPDQDVLAAGEVGVIDADEDPAVLPEKAADAGSDCAGEVVVRIAAFAKRGEATDVLEVTEVVATPVIDDVTLTYYLPAAEILQSEQLE